MPQSRDDPGKPKPPDSTTLMKQGRMKLCLFLTTLLAGGVRGLQPHAHEHAPPSNRDGRRGDLSENAWAPFSSLDRRGFLWKGGALVAAPVGISFLGVEPAVAKPNGLPLTTAPNSGLRWADAKVGSGQPAIPGGPVAIDYSMASTVGRLPQIYTTKDKGAPYRWNLGDGTTIRGIELAILGNAADGIPPMLPGGVRRVIVPAALGYEATGRPNASCLEPGKGGAVGPIPPKDEEGGGYQRWYQFYCNPRIPYQPDLVLDIKLYGKR